MALISIKKANSTLRLKKDGGEFALHGNLKLRLKISDTDFPESMKEIATIGKLNDKTLKQAEAYVQNTLEETFIKSKNLGCDLFETTDMLYRKFNKDFDREKGEFFKNLKCLFTVSCQNYI